MSVLTWLLPHTHVYIHFLIVETLLNRTSAGQRREVDGHGRAEANTLTPAEMLPAHLTYVRHLKHKRGIERSSSISSTIMLT